MSYPLKNIRADPEDPLLTARIRDRVRGSNRQTLRQSILRIGEIEGHHGNRPYNILMDFLIFMVSLLEISVVIFVAVTHFHHAMGLTALAMLFPILLNFVGVIYFLSDRTERKELESVGCSRCLTDLLQFPILGPVFTAFKVMGISCGCTSHQNYERIEASAIKLRQAVGFFSAAPEALVQLTTLITMDPSGSSSHGGAANTDIHGHGTRTATENSHAADSGSHDSSDEWTRWLEVFAVCLFVFTLAESNCYNVLSNYYKMFSLNRKQSWRLDDVTVRQKLLLFLHAFTSIGSRIIASSALTAAALYKWKDESYPVVITLVIFSEIGIRLVIHYICRVLKFFWLETEIPSNCYESINFAWRSTILNYEFQSSNIFVQVLFYLENAVCFGLWVVCAQLFAPRWVMVDMFVPLCVIFSVLTGLSIVLLFACCFFGLVRMHRPCVKENIEEY